MLERTSVTTRGARPRTGPFEGVVPRSVPWLALLSVGFVAAQLVLVVPGSGLGWDEAVYTSQVSGHAPAAFFSAPRARGVSFLAAPVAALTASTLALRLYMAVLSGAGLYLALRVWRPLLPVRVLALAGGLFAGLWITLLYGSQVMPNLWSAYGALAAVGCLLRAERGRLDRAAPYGLAAGVAVVGLMRPPDAVWLVAALAAVGLAVGRWRRPAVFAALAAGLVLGCAEWVVEAYASYGGLSARLHRASEIQGGLGWHVAVDDQVRALDGRTLCRPCDVPWRHRSTALWLFALPVLAAVGAAVTPRVRRAAVGVALSVGVVLALPYLFTIDYAAPRFLLPAYALLAVPVAECLWRLVLRADGRPRHAAVAVAALALCGHLAIQGSVLRTTVVNNRAQRAEYDAVAARLHTYGVRPPCLLSGDGAQPVAFYTGCASRQTGGPDASITPAGILAAARTRPVGILVAPGAHPPAFARTWPASPLPTHPGPPGYRVYVSPRGR